MRLKMFTEVVLLFHVLKTQTKTCGSNIFITLKASAFDFGDATNIVEILPKICLPEQVLLLFL